MLNFFALFFVVAMELVYRTKLSLYFWDGESFHFKTQFFVRLFLCCAGGFVLVVFEICNTLNKERLKIGRTTFREMSGFLSRCTNIVYFHGGLGDTLNQNLLKE